ncbi:MAG: hypothetical protein WDM92_09165 [Caulobacteraceae bacterium]
MLGLIEPDAGSIRVLGSDDPRAVRDRVGFLPEERGLYRRMTPVGRHRLLRRPEGRADPRRAQARAGHAAGPGPRRGGEPADQEPPPRAWPRRVQLLSALAHDPDLVPARRAVLGPRPGEPAGAGADDPPTWPAGAPAWCSPPHVMQHAERLCDQVVLIAGGRKIFDGSVPDARAAAPRDAGAGGADRAGRRRRPAGVASVSSEAIGEGGVRVHRGPEVRRARPGAAEAGVRRGARRDPLRAEGAEPPRRLHRPDRGSATAMSRLLRIAAREYLAYVRTAGFWLSMCLLPVILGVVGGGPGADRADLAAAAPGGDRPDRPRLRRRHRPGGGPRPTPARAAARASRPP